MKMNDIELPLATFKMIVVFFFIFLISSCTKEINIEVPAGALKLVVEGRIEPNQPPYVFLSKSSGYFDLVDINTLSNSFVHGATVVVSNGLLKDTLMEICANSLPPALKPIIAAFLGLPIATIEQSGICLYTTFNPLLYGRVGQSYQLTINHDNVKYESSTSILQPVKLDSTWFKVYGNKDSLGLINVTMSEPAGLGNSYRWYAKRMTKDIQFIAPLGSVFEDRFIDGQTFNFAYTRGIQVGSTAADDRGEEARFFKSGDTVVVKFCTINNPAFLFFRSMETEAGNQGNPFASPTTVKGNITNGALGIWCGYSPTFDTVICKK